jgi:hypothetical protein
MKQGLFQKVIFNRRLPLVATCLGLVAGAAIPAQAQLTDPEEITALWFDYMVSPAITGPRFFIKTDRDILQTGPTSASFQKGRTQLVVADGGVSFVWRDQIPGFEDEWDTDQDGWRDVVEFDEAEPPSDPFDPLSVPSGIQPDVFWTVLANGLTLPISPVGAFPAVAVRPFSTPNVRLSAAPGASRLPRPLALADYSTQFYITNTGNPSPQFYALSLYGYEKDYPNPSDVSAIENDVVPGTYQAQFPTISNPYSTAAISSGFRMVPNGTLSVGLKKPTWLLRSAEALEKLNEPPVVRTWVNGRLRIDPEIPTTFKWDNIVAAGFTAGTSDQMTMRVEDETETQIWPPIGGGAVLSVSNPQITLIMQGLLPLVGPGNPAPPVSVNAFMVFQYQRSFLASNSGDTSSVTLRVPIELVRSYASWRTAMFPGAGSLENSISGPYADPDNDGLTNQQEFEAGSDPSTPTIGVFNPIHQDVTTTTATLGATLASDPFSVVDVTIFERGIVYSASSTNPFPTVDGPGVNRVVSTPADPGDFTVDVTGLTPDTQYSYSGYTITNVGTYYSSPVSIFVTLPQPPLTLPTVVSPASSSVTGTGASLGGNVTSDGGSAITELGVVYSITSANDNPFIGGTGVTKVVGTAGTGVFSVNVTGLTPGTSYSFRAYAINGLGTSHTGEIGSFTTPSLPTITSPTFANVASTSATLGGNVTSGGGLAVLQRGVVFSSTNANPVIGGAGVTAFASASSGTGVFTVNATGLLPGTLYRFKAYAINSVGTAYTAVGSFTTLATVPTVASPTITSLTFNSVILGANVTGTGQSAILERGFVYSPTAVNSNPTEGGTGVIKVTATGTTGAYTSPITGLTANTGYTFRAFARNSVGTAYTSSLAFFTTFPPLTVTSPTVTNVTDTTATLGGTVVSDGATTATGRGVVFSQNPATAPVIGDPGVTQLTATGTMGPFTVNATLLTPGTDYFFRAYAINSAGTSYSEVSSFKTLPLQLLGNAEVQWLPASQPAAEPEDGGVVTAAAQAPPVPHFVYEKDPSELSKSITYMIETTLNFLEWAPINQTDWQVDDTGSTLEATWISSEPPPSSIFFRVKGIAE